MRLERTGRRVDFLRDAVGAHLADRLLDVNRSFDQALISGFADVTPLEKTGRIRQYLDLWRDLRGDEEALPIQSACLDLYLANLTLHGVNDLPGALIQARMALKPDGLFLATLFGGESLQALAASLMQADMDVFGGVSPRVAPMIEIRDMGALLQRAGFSLPVVDTTRITVTYADLLSLLRDLRGMGESNVLHARHKAPLTRRYLAIAEDYYRAHHAETGTGRLVACFDILYALGWAPHDSQPKPLVPGSGQVSLTQILTDKSS